MRTQAKQSRVAAKFVPLKDDCIEDVKRASEISTAIYQQTAERTNDDPAVAALHLLRDQTFTLLMDAPPSARGVVELLVVQAPSVARAVSAKEDARPMSLRCMKTPYAGEGRPLAGVVPEAVRMVTELLRRRPQVHSPRRRWRRSPALEGDPGGRRPVHDREATAQRPRVAGASRCRRAALHLVQRPIPLRPPSMHSWNRGSPNRR